LTGKVGSGKSSFLKSLYAEIPIVSGSAEVLGRDLTTIKRRDIPFLRRDIGIVFQDFRLLTDRNVYDNLMFVLDATGWTDKEQKVERVEKVLSDVGMLNKGYKMPMELSGGEQQRIVMARAMLNSPKLILADEPTGNLDPETGSRIMMRFHEIAESGTSVIIATHNHSLLKQYPSRTLNCIDKHIVE
jgi:cell division transport system ATP-binding protein